jgi:hypothetical protein
MKYNGMLQPHAVHILFTPSPLKEPHQIHIGSSYKGMQEQSKTFPDQSQM